MLSKREVDVYHLMVAGLSNREIAERLFVTVKAVKFHITNIYKKYQVTSRAEFLVAALGPAELPMALQ